MQTSQESRHQRRTPLVPFHQRQEEAGSDIRYLRFVDTHSSDETSDTASHNITYDNSSHSMSYVPSTSAPLLSYDSASASDAGSDITRSLTPNWQHVRFEVAEMHGNDMDIDIETAPALTPEQLQLNADRFARAMSRGLCIFTVLFLGTMLLVAGVYLAFVDPAQLVAMWW